MWVLSFSRKLESKVLYLDIQPPFWNGWLYLFYMIACQIGELIRTQKVLCDWATICSHATESRTMHVISFTNSVIEGDMKFW